MSREHVLTRSVFGEGVVMSSGDFPWGEKPMDIDNLVANILCSKHNSDLSPLDKEIKKFGDSMKAAWDVGRKQRLTVNGFLLERWLLKFYAGIAASGWLKEKSLPHEQVVRTIFGLDRLPASVALFGLSVAGSGQTNRLSISFDFLYSSHNDGALGVVVAINGAPLVLSVCLRNVELYVRSRRVLCGYDVSTAIVQRHPPSLRISSDHGSEIFVAIDWSSEASRRSRAIAPKPIRS